jgi:hypothetical protein
MKTLILLFSAVLLLSATTAMSNTNDLEKQTQNVRKQVKYALANSEISDKGTVTIYFYAFGKKVKVQKIEGANENLNQKVKEILEKDGFNRKVLNGYYTITIKLGGSVAAEFSKKEKAILNELMATDLAQLRNMAMAE